MSHGAERIPFRKPSLDPATLLLYLGHCIQRAVGHGGVGGGGILEGDRGSARLTNKYAKLLSFFSAFF